MILGGRWLIGVLASAGPSGQAVGTLSRMGFAMPRILGRTETRISSRYCQVSVPINNNAIAAMLSIFFMSAINSRSLVSREEVYGNN